VLRQLLPAGGQNTCQGPGARYLKASLETRADPGPSCEWHKRCSDAIGAVAEQVAE